MAEHTIKDTLETTSEYMGSQIRGALSSKEDEFRVDELPTPSTSIEGEIYQYMGDSTVDYQHGFFYECVALGTSPETYGWQVTNVQPTEEGQTIQVDELPTASSETEGDIYQYVGSTTANYTHGYFYECKAQGTDPETYTWEKVNTTDVPDTTINTVYDTTRTDFRFTPIMTVDIYDVLTKNGRTITLDDITYCGGLFEEGRITQSEFNRIINAITIPAFSSATDEQMDIILSAYYNGYLPLNKITAVWKVGDTRNVSIGAIAATDIYDGSSAQTVQMMIVDINKNTLVTPTAGATKALLTLHAKDTLSARGKLDTFLSSNSLVGWENMKMRAFLRSNFYSAIPSAMRARIKNINRSFTTVSVTQSVQDTIYFLSEEEVTGGYAYYDSPTKRPKSIYWNLCSETYKDSHYCSMCCYAGGNIVSSSYNSGLGVAPAFCI